MRWLVLDEVLAIEKKKVARTRSHIPEAPPSSECLIMEMMAQTGGLLLGAETDFKEDVIFAKIERARFYPGFSPGEKIEIGATSENLRSEGAWFESIVEAQNGKVAESRFLLMNVGSLVPTLHRSVTFHETFMNYFHIREKIR